MLRVLVCGGRNFADRPALYAALDQLHAARSVNVVVAGGARGADALAVEWATDRGIATEVYAAEWRRFGRAASPIRNQRMLTDGRPDLVVAFAGGPGTAGMIALARAAGVKVFECDGGARPSAFPSRLSH